MAKTLTIIQIIVAILLMTVILIQSRSGGLSEVFGGGGAEIYRTKRGLEKFIFIATIMLSVIFLGLAFINLFF